MTFEIVEDVRNVETIAAGSGIRNIKRLRARYGPGNRRKMKGVAGVRLESGFVRVIDESNEDYLYPESYFAPVDLPSDVEDALLR